MTLPYLVCASSTELTVPGTQQNSLSVEGTEERERGELEEKEREGKRGEKEGTMKHTSGMGLETKELLQDPWLPGLATEELTTVFTC